LTPFPSILIDLPQGETWRRLYGFLPAWSAASLAFALGSWLLWRALAGRIRGGWRAATTRADKGRQLIVLLLYCLAVVLACDGLALSQGFFRQDDFSFLQVTRETPLLAEQLLIRHNDHVCVFYRFEIWLLVHLAGPQANALALAAWFNVTNLLSCLSLLLASCWLLHELGGSRLSLFCLAGLVWLWPGWGEFTAGYYTISLYLQIQAAGLAAAAALTRGHRLRSTTWLAIGLLLALVAAGLGSAGVPVFLAVGGICGALLWTGAPHRELRICWVLLLVGFVIVASAYLWIGGWPRTPRELVQNPQALTVGPATLGSALTHFPSLFASGIAAALNLPLMWFVPTFLQLSVHGEQVSSGVLWVYAFTTSLLVGVGAIFGRPIWRRLGPNDCIVALALFTNSLLFILLVLVARTSYATAVPAPLWPAKYVMFPLTWWLIGVVFIADRLWLARSEPAGKWPALIFLGSILGIWFTCSLWHLEGTLLPAPLPYVARGRSGNLITTRARAIQYRQFMGELAPLAAIHGNRALILPPPEIWSGTFFNRYPLLEWGSDHASRGVTHLFWDMPAAAPAQAIHGRWAIAGDFGGAERAELAELAKIPWLHQSPPTSSH
jgi:hypothetical protein